MHKLPQPVKLWYLSSFFRRERPQKPAATASSGRSARRRSAPTTPRVDAESILLLAELLEALGARGLRLRLVSLGTPDDARRLPRGAQRAPARPRGPALAGGPRPHRPQPAARVRRRPPRHARRDGGARRCCSTCSPTRTTSTSRPSRRCSTPRASPTRSTRRSCAAWTTTRARCSSSPPTRSAPSPASAAAGATTG